MINKFSVHNGAKYFSSGTFQNYLVFTPSKKDANCLSGTTRIYSLQSNGISEENIENIAKTNSNFALILLIIIYYQTYILILGSWYILMLHLDFVQQIIFLSPKK